MPMQAAVLHGIKDLRYESVDMPIPVAGEVLFRIGASGICGSDVDRMYGKGAYHYPIILGHEFAGWRVDNGKKATVFPLLPCKTCAMCQIGEFASCNDYDYYGSRRNGGFAEHISVMEWNVIEAPDNADIPSLAMTEPAAVALHAVDMLGILPGYSVLVTGAGPIGLIVGQWAMLSGAFAVYYTDIDPRKLEHAKSMGFHPYQGESVDCAVEGTGHSQPLEQILAAAKPRGTVVLMGNPAGDIHLTQKGYWHILRKQLTLQGTWNSKYNRFRDEWSIAVQAIASGKINVSGLITHRYPLSECNAAFETLRDRTEFVNKVMFIFE